MTQNTKLTITLSFFKLQSPDFAWKFIWTEWINNKMAEKIKWQPKTKWPPNHKIDHNSFNFQARSSRFCMVVHIDILQITYFGKQNGRQKQNGHQIDWSFWYFDHCYDSNDSFRSSRFSMVVHGNPSSLHNLKDKIAAIGCQPLVQKWKMLNKNKKCTFTPAFSTSYLLSLLVEIYL